MLDNKTPSQTPVTDHLRATGGWNPNSFKIAWSSSPRTKWVNDSASLDRFVARTTQRLDDRSRQAASKSLAAAIRRGAPEFFPRSGPTSGGRLAVAGSSGEVPQPNDHSAINAIIQSGTKKRFRHNIRWGLIIGPISPGDGGVIFTHRRLGDLRRSTASDCGLRLNQVRRRMDRDLRAVDRTVPAAGMA